MKDFLIKYLLLLIIGIATIIFCLAAIMQNIFNMELKDSLSILIAFISIFTTFGGAYLGAKISGENAIKLNRYNNKRDLVKLKYERNIKFEYFIENKKNFFEIDIPRSIKNHKSINKNIEIIETIEEIPFNDRTENNHQSIQIAKSNNENWQTELENNLTKLISFINKSNFYKVDAIYRQYINELIDLKNDFDITRTKEYPETPVCNLEKYKFLEEVIKVIEKINKRIAYNKKLYKEFEVEL